MQIQPPARFPRSMLFVSGERADRFGKAAASGADVMCIDLEDAVAPDRKADARRAVLDWLRARVPAPAGPALALRLNGVRTLDGLRDVLALAESEVELDWLLLPKIEHAADVQAVHEWAGERFHHLVALLETARGIENAASVAAAGGKLAALMLGGADLAADLGASFSWDGLLHARGALVNAAKAAGLQAWDVPHIDLSDPDGLAVETRRVLAMGFDCKTAIHPQQLSTIHAAFAPSPGELSWAQALLDALPGGEAGGAFVFQGRMVDAPVLRNARRILERARLT